MRADEASGRKTQRRGDAEKKIVAAHKRLECESPLLLCHKPGKRETEAFHIQWLRPFRNHSKTLREPPDMRICKLWFYISEVRDKSEDFSRDQIHLNLN